MIEKIQKRNGKTKQNSKEEIFVFMRLHFLYEDTYHSTKHGASETHFNSVGSQKTESRSAGVAGKWGEALSFLWRQSLVKWKNPKSVTKNSNKKLSYFLKRVFVEKTSTDPVETRTTGKPKTVGAGDSVCCLLQKKQFGIWVQSSSLFVRRKKKDSLNNANITQRLYTYTSKSLISNQNCFAFGEREK